MQSQGLTSPLRHAIESRRDALLRLAIITAVLALSALIALRTPGLRTAVLVVALPVAVAAVAVLLHRPGLGLALLVAGGLVVPITLGTGTGTSLNPVILLVPLLTGLWVLEMIINRREIHLHRHPAVYLILILCAVVVLAFIVGQLPWYSTPGAGFASQAGGMLVFFLSAAAFLLAAHVLNEQRLIRLIALFLGLSTIYLVARLLSPYSSIVLRFYDSGAIGAIFWIWTVALAAGLSMFWSDLQPRFRVGLAGLAVLALMVALVQSPTWASGWAPPLVALLILFWLRFPKWGWVPLAVSLIVMVVRQEAVLQLATEDQSWLARRQAWQIVLDAAMVNPLLGLGPSNYYFIVEQFTIGGWGGVWNVKFNSHNNFVDIIAQTGLIGLLVFLAFAAVMGTVGWKLHRSAPAGGFIRAYAAACIAGLIATLASGMLGDWFLPFVYNIGLAGMRSSILFWVFMGGLLHLWLQPHDYSTGSRRE